MPAAASATRNERMELGAYVRARAADSLGSSSQAVRNYATALTSDPANEIIASGALRQALAGGDRALALKAARILDGAGLTTPEVRLMLITEAARTGGWAEVDRQVDALAKDEVFNFMLPIIRSWSAIGSGKGDPLALLATGASDPLAGSYVAEHRPLILLALGRDREGMNAIRSRAEAEDTRAQRLLVSAASRLARQGKHDEALAMVSGDGAMVTLARLWLEKHDRLPGEIVAPAQGIAEFFLRIAIDLRRQEVLPLALSFARLSTFLAPDHVEGWLVTSDLLAVQGQEREALAVLGGISAAGPSAVLVNDARIGLLSAIGDNEAALAQAAKRTRGNDATAGDWTRLGDIYSQLKRHSEAAQAYSRALQASGSEGNVRAQWLLYLLLGGAHERAGQWPEGKAALEAAYRLAPKEPLVLNYLGYAQLERRENLKEAERLIAEASLLDPDSPQITDSLGWAHYLQGDVKRAIELLERAVRDEPSDAAINEHLGDAYYVAGRRYEARYAWKAALLSAEGDDAPRLRAKIDTGLTQELTSP